MWLKIAKNYKIDYINGILIRYNYVQKIVNWKKRKNTYHSLMLIYKENLKIASFKEKPLVIFMYIQFLLKFLIASILSIF